MRARAPGASASTGGSAGKAIAVIALERQLRSRLRLRWRVRWQRNSGTSERSHTALQWRDHSLKDATRSPITNTTFFALYARVPLHGLYLFLPARAPALPPGVSSSVRSQSRPPVGAGCQGGLPVTLGLVNLVNCIGHRDLYPRTHHVTLLCAVRVGLSRMCNQVVVGENDVPCLERRLQVQSKIAKCQHASSGPSEPA